jgi:hypothetical protein
MKNDVVQTNFTAGEVSPLLYGRTDVARYQNGLKKSLNFIGLPQGGITRRPGTRHREVARRDGIFYEFVFSVTQAYVLEFTSGKIRFFRDGAQIKDAVTLGPYELSTPYSQDDLAQLSFTQSADILWICHPKKQTRVLSRLADNSWTLGLFDTLDGPYISNPVHGVTMTVAGLDDTADLVSNVDLFVVGTDNDKYISFQEDDQWRLGRIVEVYEPRRCRIRYMSNVMLGLDQETIIQAESQVGSSYGKIAPSSLITWSGNVVTSDHADTFTTLDAGKVIRVYMSAITADPYISAASPGKAQYSWYLMTKFKSHLTMDTTNAFGAAVSPPGTYKDYNINTVRVTLQSRTILGSLTSSAASFKTTDIGRKIRLNYSSAITWGKITAYGSPSVVSIQLYESVPLDQDQRDNASTPLATQLSNNGATTKWQLGAWSDTTGWPSVATFYQGRLWFARTDSEPQSVWGSVGDDYFNFAPTELDSVVTDLSAITKTLASERLNEIVWLVGAKSLMIGTTGAEWQMSSENQKDLLTSKNVSATTDTSHGSQKGVRPIKVGNSILFLSAGGATLRKLAFDFSADSFVTKDLTIIADHVLRAGGGAKQVLVTKDPNTVIWVLRNDGKIASLTYEEEQEVYGWHLHDFGDNQTKVISMAAVPDPVTRQDVLYLMVCRMVNGVQTYFVESMLPRYFQGQTDPIFLDNSLSYSGSPVSTLSGLSHLEGATVDVVADGAYVGSQVVTGGTITLENPSFSVHVGLGYLSTAVLLPPVVTSRAGSGVMHTQHVSRAAVQVYESMEFYHGEDEAKLRKESFRTTSTPNNLGSPVFSGVRDIFNDGGWSRQPSIVIQQKIPYPLTVLSVAMAVEVSDHA